LKNKTQCNPPPIRETSCIGIKGLIATVGAVKGKWWANFGPPLENLNQSWVFEFLKAI